MQHGMRAEILLQPAIEGGEGMRRGETALEQQPHRIALIPQRRLDADEHIAELRAENLYCGAVRLQLAGGWAPGSLDLGKVRFALHDRVGADARVDVRLGAVARRITAENALAHFIGRRGDIDDITLAVELLERGVE